ncbi:hypothetical protein ACPXCX_54780, partial [Streptomyces sp. DT225]
ERLKTEILGRGEVQDVIASAWASVRAMVIAAAEDEQSELRLRARASLMSLGARLATDERLIEAANVFEGKTFGVGDGALRKPDNWKHLTNPFRPSWGEPYI